MRKLASVQIIKDVTPIFGADRIELVKILGWDVIVGKGEFSVGDKCVFFEIDSVIPATYGWASPLKRSGYRVKTLKMKGAISQGFAVPLRDIFTEDTNYNSISFDDDLTELLGVTKHDPVLPERNITTDKFPRFLPKTDETRLESCLTILHEMHNRPYYVTEKCDGQSATFFNDGGTLRAASRNWCVEIEGNKFARIAEKHNLNDVLPDGVAIQGELCGPGIQGNKHGLLDVELYVFDILRRDKDNTDGKWSYVNLDSMLEFCDNAGLNFVKVLEMGVAFDHTLESLRVLAENGGCPPGFYAGTTNLREGVVVRPVELEHSVSLNSRMSFKVISQKFLLKHGQ